MNSKQLTILAVLAAIAGGVFFMVNSNQEKAISRGGGLKIGDRAVPDLDVPSVTSLSITKAGEAVTLEKDGDIWIVAERDGFVADANKIRGLLYSLKDMKISESRRMRGPSALKELALLDPESDTDGAGTGTVVKFSGSGGSGSLVFGKSFASTAGRGGRFIRTEDGAVHVATTVLMNVETDAPAWLERRKFFGIEKPKMISVTQEKPEDSYTLIRESEGGALALQGLAEGEEANTEKLASLGTLLDQPKFVDVIVGDAADPETTGLDKPITASVETFDGFKYVVSVGKETDDRKHYFSYQVSAEIADGPAEPDPAPAPVEDPAEQARLNTEKGLRKTKREEAKRLKDKLAAEQVFAGKVFTIDTKRVEAMLKTRGELLMTEEDRTKAAEAAKAAAAGGRSPNVISQGPGGERRVTATTPPVSIDPKILEAERIKQEKAVIEKAKADQDAAAIRRMLDAHRQEKADAAAAESEPTTPAETTEGDNEAPEGEGKKPTG